MTHKPNPRQLVLRRDTATGMTLVGWETDMPIGRFEHLALICETDKNTLPGRDDEYYDVYQSAICHAREANNFLVERQVRDCQAKGWYRVPFELAHETQAMQADSVGNYAAAAMQLHYCLTHNCKQAWAVIQRGVVMHVRSRYPKKQLDELTYQVWYHKQLNELEKLDGTVLEGSLNICESGLWFNVK